MRKRFKMSRGASRRDFSRKAVRMNRRNKTGSGGSLAMRGGIRL